MRRRALAAVAAAVSSAILAAGAGAQGPAACGGDLAGLAWMAGEWTGDRGGVRMTESWMEPRGGLMLGTHRDVADAGRTFFEFLRIAPDEAGIPVYHASPGGRAATSFRLVECGSRRVVFENPGHDYPQRVVYEREGDSLTARIEGVVDGEERSSAWRYSRSREADRRALIELQETERRAHLDGDVDLLVSLFADGFVGVADGRVSRPGREEQRERFTGYLGSVDLLEWDDIEPPMIRISDDGSMAWILVHKRVRSVPAGEPDAAPEHTVFAWLETWEKRDGEWKLTSVTSTDRPGGPPD